MRLLSLNTWGGALHAELLEYLVQADADVYCLQEVSRSRASRAAWLTYRDGQVEIPQRANLFDELGTALPDHDGFFAPTGRGQLFEGDTPRWQEFGLATFVRSSIPVIGQLQDFVHGQFGPSGFGAHPRARNAHAFRLYDYEAEHPVTVVQLHGLREESGKGDTAARADQATALIELIQRLWRPDEPLIVGGDLNVLPNSSLFNQLRELGLTELVTSRGYTDTRTSLYTKLGRFADYLLVSADVDVRNFDVVEAPEVSDHRPLVLSFG